ncbi:hypothetical protein AL1_14310 [Alistipes shahii WAL 8301]|uniref:Uncharacterized protein n=1 Tax=Alistipes shahii WAL 8301 TaxID=717959 RepID=D4ILR6_9BACT|nr:hypothetical protein [Alistipes shahii]CBK63878.1 hypothetical protein AL1_14310 [Alistipes shahii WAL 8301]
MKKILMICLALVMGLGMCAAAGKPAQKKEVTTVSLRTSTANTA